MIWREEWPNSCLLLSWVDVVPYLKINLTYLCNFFYQGKQIDGVWHTGVVAYGREYFFGGAGIQACIPVSNYVLCAPTTH